jgi:hypothetical protein
MVDGAFVHAFAHTAPVPTIAHVFARIDANVGPTPEYIAPAPFAMDMDDFHEADRWQAFANLAPVGGGRGELDERPEERSERADHETSVTAAPAVTESPASVNAVGDATHGAATALTAYRVAIAVETGQLMWNAPGNAPGTPGFLSSAWIALQDEPSAVEQKVAGERPTLDGPPVWDPGTGADLATHLPAAPWLAELLTSADALRASDSGLAIEQFVGQVEDWGQDLQARVTAVLHSPWMVGTTVVVATIVVARLARRRGQAVLEMPGITGPAELT